MTYRTLMQTPTPHLRGNAIRAAHARLEQQIAGETDPIRKPRLQVCLADVRRALEIVGR
jgi:hypothetical protein